VAAVAGRGVDYRARFRIARKARHTLRVAVDVGGGQGRRVASLPRRHIGQQIVELRLVEQAAFRLAVSGHQRAVIRCGIQAPGDDRARRVGIVLDSHERRAITGGLALGTVARLAEFGIQGRAALGGIFTARHAAFVFRAVPVLGNRDLGRDQRQRCGQDGGQHQDGDHSFHQIRPPQDLLRAHYISTGVDALTQRRSLDSI